LKKDYIPELSEVRMVRRAPERPFVLSEEDGRYIERCLREVEEAFGVVAFPGTVFSQIRARALISQLIDWWRALEPGDERQRKAHARLPSAIRLLDTVSIWMEEWVQRK
jgi:murein L,D-transpeptidase YafK